MFTGEIVVVITPTKSGSDEFGDPINGEPTKEAIDNVLVAPGGSKDLDESRPNGSIVQFTLYFPKPFSKALKGCSIVVRGVEYRVIGDPKPYLHNVLGKWWYPAEVEDVDG